MSADRETRSQAKAVYRILCKTYPNIRCELDFTNPLQLLVATVLSAQCTDKRVNLVTPPLFKKYKTAKDYSRAKIEDIEELKGFLIEHEFDRVGIFTYSHEENTHAYLVNDDVPEEVKGRRLQEIIDVQRAHALLRNKAIVGNTYEVLIESTSKKSDQEYSGRTTQNTVVIFPKGNYKPGDYCLVKITECTSATLKGELVTA